MTHSFNVEIACKYGIKEAILIEYFATQINEYCIAGCDSYDVRHTPYGSYSTICFSYATRVVFLLFPEFNSEDNIRKIMRSLIKQGAIIKVPLSHDKGFHWCAFTKNMLDILWRYGIITEQEIHPLHK